MDSVQLYLARHGQAEGRSASGRDFDRELTAKGREQVRRNAHRLRQLGAIPSIVLSSPLLRALETARIAAQELGFTGEILPSPALTPERTPAEMWSEIRDYNGAGSLLVITHEPLVSAALSLYTGQSALYGSFGTGTIARLDFEHLTPVPRGALRWMLRPDVDPPVLA